MVPTQKKKFNGTPLDGYISTNQLFILNYTFLKMINVMMTDSSGSEHIEE